VAGAWRSLPRLRVKIKFPFEISWPVLGRIYPIIYVIHNFII